MKKRKQKTKEKTRQIAEQRDRDQEEMRL